MTHYERLYDVAFVYIDIIRRIESTHDPALLVELEEERVIWHNRLIDVLRREGIPFHDPVHVTAIAYLITRDPQ